MHLPYDIITFDCYGTLIDWDRGIGDWFVEAAAADGVQLERAKALALYAEIEPVVEAGVYRRYRDVLAETAGRVARRLGWLLSPERAASLADSLPGWRPFDDTNPSLERLSAAGYRLGILSNVDDDLLAGTGRNFSVRFDLLVTAEQVVSYKPAHGHFLAARERIGTARWLHAAQSAFHDIAPARSLAIPSAWVNRKGQEPFPEAIPDIEVRTLSELVDRLGQA